MTITFTKGCTWVSYQLNSVLHTILNSNPLEVFYILVSPNKGQMMCKLNKTHCKYSSLIDQKPFVCFDNYTFAAESPWTH